MSEENVTGQQSQENEGNKVEKLFTKNLGKLTDILNQDPARAGKTKVAPGDVPLLVSKMLEERRVATAKEASERLSKVLDQYIAFNKFVKQSQKELESKITEKKKEFNKEMEACFALIENIDSVAAEYEKLLKEGGTEEPKQEDKGATNNDEDLNPEGHS